MQSIIASAACAIVFFAAAAAMPAQAASKGADEQFKALYTKEWTWRQEQYAEDEDGKRPVIDHLPKVDPASQEMRLHYWQDVMTQLNAIPRDKLSAENQVNYDVYKPQIAALIASQQFRDYEMPANSDSSFWADIGYTARRPFKTLADYQNWIAQMRDMPRYFHEQTEEMRAGAARGFTPPRVTLQGRDSSFTTVTTVKPEDTMFYTPFKQMLSSIPADQQAQLRAQALDVIEHQIQPAYVELQKFWNDEYLPKTRTTLAAYDLPDGKAYYQVQILEYTTLNMTPEQIHQVGLDEVAKLHEQMVEQMKATGFKGDFPAFLNYLRTDPKFYAKTPQELLNDAAWIAKVFDGKASQYFGHLPRGRFTIKPVPAELAPFYTSGRGGPGTYLLNTYDLPHRPLYNLTALTLHESAPGHAFQIPLAMEQKDLPDFRRYTYISAYGEGWALYCEYLGDEMGMYETPYDKFGMLGYQIWRAVRLVVDTGIHSQGWTREQAVKYMHDYTALPDHEINTEVDRYISWPGQALSYYLGEMDIRKNRARAEQALGPKFNLRAFHDAILQVGSVPLPVLDARTDQFIAGGGVGPYPDEEQ
ncbi:MAG TPA: DUF885 family protein [Rhizomicrobium sp.]|jgi:uncharacterized protein (DUF885 family)|nr:DUF885 family protein [Rhizomicrobium sp.]